MLPKENNTRTTHMFFSLYTPAGCTQTSASEAQCTRQRRPLDMRERIPARRRASAAPLQRTLRLTSNSSLRSHSLRTSELDEVTPRLVFPSKKPSARLLASFSRASPTHQQAGAHRAPSLSFRPRRHGLRHPRRPYRNPQTGFLCKEEGGTIPKGTKRRQGSEHAP